MTSTALTVTADLPEAPCAPSAVSLVEILRNHHISFPRDNEVAGALKELAAQIPVRRDTSAPHGPLNRDEQDVLVITGATGSGKNFTIKRALRAVPAPFDAAATIERHTLLVKFPSAFSTKELARRILKKLGLETIVDEPHADAELWALVSWHLQMHGVLVLHLDEFQRWKTERGLAGTSHRIKAIYRLAEILNDLLLNEHWPVSLVISGLPEVLEFWDLEAMDQVNRRSKFVSFAQMSGAYRSAMGVAISDYAALAGIKVTLSPSDEVAERLIFASGHTVGIALEYAQEAVISAVSRGSKELELKDFLMVYAKRNPKVPTAKNPFHSPQWRELTAPEPTTIITIEENDLNGRSTRAKSNGKR